MSEREWPETIFGKMPGTWVPSEDYEAYMHDLMACGRAVSVLKEDGKQYHVPLLEYALPRKDEE